MRLRRGRRGLGLWRGRLRRAAALPAPMLTLASAAMRLAGGLAATFAAALAVAPAAVILVLRQRGRGRTGRQQQRQGCDLHLHRLKTLGPKRPGIALLPLDLRLGA